MSTAKKTLSRRQIIFAAAFGNYLEFFDFTVFATFAVMIGKAFFPSDDGATDLLKALATFGVGFIMRPVGGIVIGYYADKKGRKPAMILTLGLMTLATLIIACAPTYAMVGVWGAVILVFARLLQGFAAGGEVGASTTLMVESAPSNRRGLYSSWQLATQGASTMTGGILAAFLASSLSPEDLNAWGWRVPFFIGALLGPVGLMLRLRIEEAVTLQPQSKAGVSETTAPEIGKLALLKEHYKTILIGIMLTIGLTISTFLTLYFYSNMSAKFLGIPTRYTGLGIMIAGFFTMSIAPLGGYLSDIHGRKPLVFYTRLALLVLSVPSYWVLTRYPSPEVLFAVITVMTITLTLGAAPSILIVSEFFPRAIRAMGFAIVYSAGVAIFGGFAQFFAAELIVIFDSTIAPSIYMVFGCLISLIALPFVQDQYRSELK